MGGGLRLRLILAGVIAIALVPLGGSGASAATAPVIVTPVAGAPLRLPASVSVTADDPGVELLVDGVRQGFSAAPPFTFPLAAGSVADGPHSLVAVGCDVTGTVCDGLSSEAHPVTVVSLSPRIATQSPTPFSPNSDGVKDTTTASLVLPDAERVSWSVTTTDGTEVRAAVSLGLRAAGTHALVWNGRSTAGTVVPDGTYAIRVLTRSADRYGLVSRAVVVHTGRPVLTSVTGSGVTFFPVVDGYRDTFAPSAVVDERSALTLTVRTLGGSVVRRITATRAAGRASLVWNGRTLAGALVAAGPYTWALSAVDPAGNSRSTPRYRVTVSAKRLVSTTLTVQTPARFWHEGSGTDTCATIASSSYGATGVWIRNECDPDVVGVQWVDLVYRLTLPAAYSYGTLTLWTYGHTHANGGYVPLVRLVGGIETTAHAWTDGSIDARATTGAWFRLLSLPASGRVSVGRQVMVRLSVPDYWKPPPNEFDARTVKVTVTARVLR